MMPLVRIVKNWDSPHLLRQTTGEKGIWGGIRFTLDAVEDCDYLIFLNNCMTTPTTVRCPRENIWAIMQEPFQRGHTDWMREGHVFFSKVFTPYPPSRENKYVRSQPALPWHVDKTYDELLSLPLPQKEEKLSWIVGNANTLPGHDKRFNLLRTIQKSQILPIDLYGRAVCPIEDKWTGLAPYRYSLAIENSAGRDYWTEKLADCFLSWTVPIYYGCSNLEDYFPGESFIRINIDEPERCVEEIMAILASDDWGKRLPALEEARNLILNRYQLFPFLAERIHASPDSEYALNATRQTIPPYRRSLKAALHKTAYNLIRKIK